MTKSDPKQNVLILGAILGVIIIVISLVLVTVRALGPNAGRKQTMTVDLKDNLNAKFTESVLVAGGNDGENNLGTFPQGLQHFGGTLFNVQGIVQLSSLHLRMEHKNYPEHVEGIKIERQCRRLHMLHGAGWDDRDGKRIAQLVLHYADGSEREIKIIFGEHLRSWSGAPSEKPTGPASKLVWTGTNPVIRQRGSHLRIYKSTFENPQPDKRIETVDYLSLMANSAPFMIALTVE